MAEPVVTSDWIELKRVSHRDAVPNEQNSGYTFQRNFRKLGNKLLTLPSERSNDMALRVFYFARDESPSGEEDLENGWMREFPDLFIAEVGFRLAQDLEDTGAQRYFSAMLQEARRAYDNKIAEERFATQVLTF